MPIDDSNDFPWPTGYDDFDWDEVSFIVDSVSNSQTEASSSAYCSFQSPQRQETTESKNVNKGKGRENLTAWYEPSASALEGERETDGALVEDTDVESASSSVSNSLFLDSRYKSWETQATQYSFTAAQKKQPHEFEFEGPHLVATPLPEAPDSPSPSGICPREDNFPLQKECDVFSTTSSPKPAGPHSTTHNAPPPGAPDSITQRAPPTEKPSIKTLPLPIEHVMNSPPNRFDIAHDDRVQMCIEKRKLAWGVQWEIARGVADGRWKWEDIKLEMLDQLVGTNAEAAWKVHGIIRGEPTSAVALNTETQSRLWQELDREQKAIIEGRDRGIGLFRDQGDLEDWEGAEKWYGGQIQQVAQLKVVEPSTSSSKTPSKISKKHSSSDPPRSFRIRLEMMGSTRSFELARFFGSRRIVIVHVENDLKGDDAREYLEKNRFVICGRVFVAIQAKESSVYLVETNEDICRKPDREQGDDSQMSLQEIIDWYNPLKYNYEQAISKWSTRWQLGLSTSVPAMEFEGKNIFFIGDEVAGTDPMPDARFVLTDGCGLMNGSAMSFLAAHFNYPSQPTTVQGRIAGSKGLWILHPTDRSPSEPRKIWIRDSQRKVMHPPFEHVHRSHRIFNLVAVARVSAQQRLSKQSLINLSHGGVPNHVFEDLLCKTFDEETGPLIDWDAPAPVLWNAVYQAGGVNSSRLQSQARGLGRVLGVTGRKFHENVGADNADGEGMPPDRKDVAGQQFTASFNSVYENALQLVQSGFHPQHCVLLNEKLKRILHFTIDSCVKEYRFPLPLSAGAFIAPDPFGVLEEGEVFFQSSKPLQDPETQERFHIFCGEVLILRYPIDQPYNVRKMVAVSRPELQDYVDVILLSCRGSHSPANDLGGGDYDGDYGTITAASQIAKAFSDSEVLLPPSDFVETNFEKNIVTVRSLMENDAFESRRTIQSQLLSCLAKDCVGIYSTLHDISTYERGYDHEETRRLGWMFTHHVDAGKSGLRPQAEVTKADLTKYWRSLPSCFKPVTPIPDEKPANRDPTLGTFVLDFLHSKGGELREKLLVEYKGKPHSNTKDGDLCKPYMDAKDRAEKAARKGITLLCDELKQIELHVKNIRQQWPEVYAQTGRASKSDSRNLAQRDSLAELVNLFSVEPSDLSVFSKEDTQLVKASYAYWMDFNSSKPDYFAFCMASQTLCEIKARSQGLAPITQLFGSCMSISASTVRVLTPHRVT